MNGNLIARSQHFQKYTSHVLIWEKILTKYGVNIISAYSLKKRVLEVLRGLDFILEGKEGQSKMSWASIGL